MPTLQASGTQTTTVIGTEYTLADLTSPFAVFQLEVDMVNMASGDTTLLQIYTKVLSTSGLDRVILGPYTGPVLDSDGQPTPVVVSLPIISDQEIKFTIKQTSGVTRNYPWKVVSVP